jgi:hypothetical protein
MFKRKRMYRIKEDDLITIKKSITEITTTLDRVAKGKVSNDTIWISQNAVIIEEIVDDMLGLDK